MTEVVEKVPDVDYDFGKKKKKKTKKEGEEKDEKTDKETTKEQGEKKVETNNKDLPVFDVPNYTYEILVDRIFNFIDQSGEEGKVKYTMKPPVVYREGTKKTIWVNFQEICKIMERSPDHVLAFLLAELGTTGSIDGNGRFVIRGRFQPKHIENVLRRYINEYVKCHTCKTPETELKRESRLLFMVCKKCGSKRSVTAIKAGFQATTRASRKAQKV